MTFLENLRAFQEGRLMYSVEEVGPNINVLHTEVIPGQEGCDFCSVSWDKGWIYETDFDDGWWACLECSELIENDDEEGLFVRSVKDAERRFGRMDAEAIPLVTAMVTTQQRKFLRGKTGVRVRDDNV